jgi:hypothetical protein
MGRGLAVGDVDNDGREDVLILSHNQPLAYLHNRSDHGRFLTLRLEGRTSNRDAVGAKVAVEAGGHRRVAWRVGGGSYQSASDPRIHFGLGPAHRIEAVEVMWPSGRTTRYRDLRPDAGYLLREGEDQPRPLAGFPGAATRPSEAVHSGRPPHSAGWQAEGSQAVRNARENGNRRTGGVRPLRPERPQE